MKSRESFKPTPAQDEACQRGEFEYISRVGSHRCRSCGLMFIGRIGKETHRKAAARRVQGRILAAERKVK